MSEDIKNTQPAQIEETVIEKAETETSQLERQLEELQLKEKAEFLSFRKLWSTYLLALVIFLSVFYAFFLIAVGKEWLRFTDEWLVRIIVTGGFAQIIALAKIVVDFLFKEQPVAK